MVITAVGNINEQNSISVFPNPSFGIITVQTQGSGEINLFNSLGEKVKTFVIPATILQLDFSDLPAGIYFLRMKNSYVQLSINK